MRKVIEKVQVTPIISVYNPEGALVEEQVAPTEVIYMALKPDLMSSVAQANARLAQQAEPPKPEGPPDIRRVK